MPFIPEVLKYKSLSIVGMQKNTGKTESLNYLLSGLPAGFNVAVTSIGIDGERRDQLTQTPKPEILLRQGTIYATSTRYYTAKSGTTEVLELGRDGSAMGRVVTARVVYDSLVMLSGPCSTAGLKRWMEDVEKYSPDMIVVDGALSRLSSASPTVSEAMILATGAALSSNLQTLIGKTAYTVQLIRLPQHKEKLSEKEQGVLGIFEDGELRKLSVGSSFSVAGLSSKELKGVRVVYLSGALTDRFLRELMGLVEISEIVVVVKDFTKVFVSEDLFRTFTKLKGRIEVLHTTQLVAVTVNPSSPSGYRLPSERLCEELSQKIGLPVYDIKRMNDE